MILDNCPFCNEGCVFDEAGHPFVSDSFKCGCQTDGCRGNIMNSPFYYDFTVMCRTWNTRPKPEKQMVTVSYDEYDELQKESQFLCALQSAGVDNWVGYEDAQDIVEEWDNE